MAVSRDFYDDKLPKYHVIREALKKAVSEALDKDHDLIALGGHEQAIAHRIAIYLEKSFPDFQTDCEYNRNKHKAKNRQPETPGSKNMRPDIIVHRRNTPDNVLAVEMKANANPATKDDKEKLQCLKAEETYLYKGTAFVCIENKIQQMESGVLTATIEWYDLRDGKFHHEVENKETLGCDKHIGQVKEIVAQRKANE